MFLLSYVSTDTAMILVANKSDLVRNRVVQTAGNGTEKVKNSSPVYCESGSGFNQRKDPDPGCKQV